jgi:hypothetical protein
MSGQAQRFKAPSYVNVEDQRLVPPRWGYSLVGLGALAFPPPPLHPFVLGALAFPPPPLHPFVSGSIGQKPSLTFLADADNVNTRGVLNSC